MKTILKYGGLNQLSDLKDIYAGKKILLVTGKSSYEKSGAKKIVTHHLAGEQVVQFVDFSTNPKISDAIEGAKLAKKNKIELIIAVGGGSVLDIAKLIKAFYAADGNEIELAKGKNKVQDPKIPIVAVPTTAGSGSEATHFAVVYIGSDKFSLAADCLLPDVVILDGSLVESGDNYLKACNALDAMAQAIESYWAVGGTDESRKYAVAALKLGWGRMMNYTASDCDSTDTQKMLEAANFAGKAINISKTTAAHAWSYAFTGAYNIPHGHAVWLTLPAIYRLHSIEKSMTSLNSSHKKKMKKLHELLGLDVSQDFELQLCNHLKKIGIESSMEQLGIVESQARFNLSMQVNTERMGNNPLDLSSYTQEIFKFNY